MCLINFHLQDHPHYKLIVAANRDEFYERPSAQAHFWQDKPYILAGRDMVQSGTWLGVTKQGRFAALTNFRSAEQVNEDKISRGEIVNNYLEGNMQPQVFLQSLQERQDHYDGFNVIVGNQEAMFQYSKRQAEITEITEGTHGLSNHLLNTPWPKVIKEKKNLRAYVKNTEHIRVDALFDILSDTEQAADRHLPETGIDMELERKLSSSFIKTPNYGTRSSSVLLVDRADKLTFVERTYKAGVFSQEKHFTFQIEN